MKNENIMRCLMVFSLIGMMAFFSGCTNLAAGQINVARTGSIQGEVFDSNGTPLAGVSISVGGKTGTTNVQGIYIIENLQIGDHLLTATYNGYKTGKLIIVVSDGNQVVQEITLEKDNTSGNGSGGETSPGNNDSDIGEELEEFTPLTRWNSRIDEEYPVFFHSVAYKETSSSILLGVEYETDAELKLNNYISCFNPPSGTVFKIVKKPELRQGKNTVIFEITKKELAELRSDKNLDQTISMLFSPLGGSEHRSGVFIQIKYLPE